MPPYLPRKCQRSRPQRRPQKRNDIQTFDIQFSAHCALPPYVRFCTSASSTTQYSVLTLNEASQSSRRLQVGPMLNPREGSAPATIGPRPSTFSDRVAPANRPLSWTARASRDSLRLALHECAPNSAATPLSARRTSGTSFPRDRSAEGSPTAVASVAHV